MRQQNVKKTPGCSWIEFGDGMHVFGTGDRTHPDEELIYSMLSSLYMSMYMYSDEVTIVGVLSGCNYGDLSRYNIVSMVKHCTCVIDMLGRAGLLE
ncbi:hypothetical protein Ccrd_023922 [Cynara cardunculus var. scolymus]|nr:hypothetical protein Ccrd_023922 [Cynara cardunculus var. scolymus]